MKRLFASVSLALTAILIIGTLLVQAKPGTSNWAQWRGNDGQGISTDTNLPTEWDGTKNVQWKTPITGRGHSSPIVWGNRIFLTSDSEGEVVPGAKAVTHMLGTEEFIDAKKRLIRSITKSRHDLSPLAFLRIFLRPAGRFLPARLM